MILTSMYTANLTAHLTLDQSNVKINELEDLLTQKEYSWGLIKDRNLETMMLNHKNNDYRRIAEKAVKVLSIDEGVARVRQGGFILLDDNSVLEIYLQGECDAKIIKTGKFSNHWAFGLQINSPYEALINNMLLRYREEGWLMDKFLEWYAGDGKSACSSSLGSQITFDLQVLSGLFLILGVGILLSFAAIFLELLYVVQRDSIVTGSGFVRCLKSTIRWKYSEIKKAWFASSKIVPENDATDGATKCSNQF